MGKIKSHRTVETITTPGRHNAGDNLYLVVTPGGSKSWVFLYVHGGRRQELGLGSAPRAPGVAADGHVSLAKAREKAAEARKLLNEGTNPKDVMGRKAKARAALTVPSFGAFADEYIAAHKPKFRNAKHVAQWEMTLGDAYCGAIRSMPVDEIDTDGILKVLQPIWLKVPETASRLRGRLENVLDAAKARGFREGKENPARWKGHLKAILPARQKLTRGHHAAMPYDDLPAFMAALREAESLSARALELCILTATRSGEVLGAKWDEIDLAKGVWSIPAVRMKAGLEHRVPLSGRALDILNTLIPLQHNPHVFAGLKRGAPLSGMAMTMQMRRMGKGSFTVHGFRSSFRDWASEQTIFSHETCEHALAHRISDKAEAAYRRGDQFEKRRLLMEAWAKYCGTAATAVVVPLRRGA